MRPDQLSLPEPNARLEHECGRLAVSIPMSIVFYAEVAKQVGCLPELWRRRYVGVSLRDADVRSP